MKDMNMNVPGEIVWGMVDSPRLCAVPHDCLRVKWKMRPGHYLRVYLKYADRIEEWVPVRIGGDRFVLRYGQGCNYTQGSGCADISEYRGMSAL